jgi:hypothetical protein
MEIEDKIVENILQNMLSQYKAKGVDLPAEYIESVRQQLKGYFAGMDERARKRAINNLLSGFN